MATLMSSRTMRLAGNAPRSAVVVPARPVSRHIGVPCSTTAAVPATFTARAHALACRAAATEVEVLSVEVASAPRVVELTIESWEAFMAEAGDQPVLVDFFTDWCGPCKLISPELEKFAAEYSGMRFAKFNCGTNDKRFAIAKGIKALPTFHMYRNNEKLGEFVGAKPVALRKFVEEHIEGC